MDMNMVMARGPLMLRPWLSPLLMPLLKPMLDTLEVMVEAMAVDMEAMVAMEAIEAMERGLQKLKLVLSQDMDMAVMVDMEVAMEGMVMDMDTMARGPLMLKLDMEVDMEDTVDIVEVIMDNLYLFSMFYLS